MAATGAPVVHVQIGDKRLPICFSQSALFRLQKETGKPPQILGLILAAGRGGPVELSQMFWAGLEGGRRKTNTARGEYSIEEASDLIDEAGGYEEVSQPEHAFAMALHEAWTSAFPVTKRLQEEADRREAEAKAAGNPSPAGENDPPATVPTGSSS